MEAVVTCVTLDNILKLAVCLPVDIYVSGQSPVKTQHVTLVRLDELGYTISQRPLPPPPPKLCFIPEIRVVDTGEKRACYAVCAPADQATLAAYTSACLEALGLPESALNPEREFFVTLSNAGRGDYRASVGAPWNYPYAVF
jgi:hypothetical protein